MGFLHAKIPAMHIQNPCVVTLMWRLEDAHGQLIDELLEPLDFFYGGQDLLAKVEEVLLDQMPGFTTTLHLEPEHAFGDYDANLVFFEERRIFPEHLEAGMQFEGLPEGSITPDMPSDMVYTVTEIYDTHVVLDGNHPLAGIALVLQLEVKDVRAASPEEIEQRSVGDTGFGAVSLAPPGTTLH